MLFGFFHTDLCKLGTSRVKGQSPLSARSITFFFFLHLKLSIFELSAIEERLKHGDDLGVSGSLFLNLISKYYQTYR